MINYFHVRRVCYLPAARSSSPSLSSIRRSSLLDGHRCPARSIIIIFRSLVPGRQRLVAGSGWECRPTRFSFPRNPRSPGKKCEIRGDLIGYATDCDTLLRGNAATAARKEYYEPRHVHRINPTRPGVFQAIARSGMLGEISLRGSSRSLIARITSCQVSNGAAGFFEVRSACGLWAD